LAIMTYVHCMFSPPSMIKVWVASTTIACYVHAIRRGLMTVRLCSHPQPAFTTSPRNQMLRH